MSEPILTLDKEAVQNVFAQAIKEEATKVIKQAISVEQISSTIREAFSRSWAGNKTTWLEESIAEAMGVALYRTVQQVIDESGVKNIIEQTTKEYLASEEFVNLIKERTIETVKSTTFHVKAI